MPFQTIFIISELESLDIFSRFLHFRRTERGREGLLYNAEDATRDKVTLGVCDEAVRGVLRMIYIVTECQ